MNRQHVKTFLATFLAALLLYYNAAWAVLRCCHVDEQGSLAEIFSPDDLHDGLYRYHSLPGDAPSQVDCLDFEYQIEVLASPASPPQFHRGTAALASHAYHGLFLKSLADGVWKTPLRNVFTRGSPPDDPSDLPIFLTLSSLRI